MAVNPSIGFEIKGARACILGFPKSGVCIYNAGSETRRQASGGWEAELRGMQGLVGLLLGTFSYTVSTENAADCTPTDYIL